MFMILCIINLLCYRLILFKPIKIKVTQTVVYETGKTMLIGYERVSKSEGSQLLDPQNRRINRTFLGLFHRPQNESFTSKIFELIQQFS
jgi:hypothetical protein